METQARTGRLRRLGRGARLLLIALLATGVGTEISGILALRLARRAVSLPPTPGRTVAVEHGERLLAEAWNALSRKPDDGPTWLRIGSLEAGRCRLLTGEAEEIAFGSVRHLEEGPRLAEWRRGFLRADPDGCLSRVTRAVHAALRGDLSPAQRVQAWQLLAGARDGLGDHRGKAAALAEAVRYAPQDASLWGRLANAYGRARRFRQAQEAHARMLALNEQQR